MKKELAVFEGHEIRRVYDETTETWWFSVVDIIQVLTQQPNYKAAQNYWKVLKHRLNKEGSQLVTNCNQLKMTAADGKQRLTDAATAETLLRLVQSVPSPKAEPIKLWLARVGYERMQEIADPARALERARETWQKQGRSAKWQTAKPVRAGIFVDFRFKAGSSSGGATSFEYAAPDGAGFVLILDSTNMPRLRRWESGGHRRPHRQKSAARTRSQDWPESRHPRKLSAAHQNRQADQMIPALNSQLSTLNSPQ